LRKSVFTDAEQQFRESVRLKPDYAAAHYNLGLALQATGDDTGAEKAFARATELDPALKHP
jgi:Flp pilus assembly protein TadD